MICHEARQWLGAEPGADRAAWPAALREHVAGCVHCQQYSSEMQAMEASIRKALEVDLARFRDPARTLPEEVLRDLAAATAAPTAAISTAAVSAKTAPAAAARRSWALAASLLLALGLGVGLWALRSEPTLASAVVEHMADETVSWQRTQPLGQSAIDAVLQTSGVHVVSTAMPVVYANACVLRGHSAPHLVVATDQGPVTVMLLRDEHISAPQDFAEGGYRGVLWPAPDGRGGIAVLARGSQGGDLHGRARELASSMGLAAGQR